MGKDEIAEQIALLKQAEKEGFDVRWIDGRFQRARKKEPGKLSREEVKELIQQTQNAIAVLESTRNTVSGIARKLEDTLFLLENLLQKAGIPSQTEWEAVK